MGNCNYSSQEYSVTQRRQYFSCDIATKYRLSIPGVPDYFYLDTMFL